MVVANQIDANWLISWAKVAVQRSVQ